MKIFQAESFANSCALELPTLPPPAAPPSSTSFDVASSLWNTQSAKLPGLNLELRILFNFIKNEHTFAPNRKTKS